MIFHIYFLFFWAEREVRRKKNKREREREIYLDLILWLWMIAVFLVREVIAWVREEVSLNIGMNYKQFSFFVMHIFIMNFECILMMIYIFFYFRNFLIYMSP